MCTVKYPVALTGYGPDTPGPCSAQESIETSEIYSLETALLIFPGSLSAPVSIVIFAVFLMTLPAKHKPALYRKWKQPAHTDPFQPSLALQTRDLVLHLQVPWVLHLYFKNLVSESRERTHIRSELQDTSAGVDTDELERARFLCPPV